jgi:hypothetical protein
MGIWIESVEAKARIIHAQLAAARSLAIDNGGDPDYVSTRYYELLRSLYEDEYSFARLVDSSDFVARYNGPAVDIYDPTVSTVIQIFNTIRNQIRSVAKSIAGMSTDERVVWPSSLDPHLSGVAHGSLIVGISLPSPEQIQQLSAQDEFIEFSDQIHQSVKTAVQSISTIPSFITNDEVSESLSLSITDPAIRDTVLVAAHRLSPTKRSGIDTVSFYGNDASESSPQPLTAKSRAILQKALDRPVKQKKYGKFIGVIREIDLDAKRFEIRNVPNIGSIRCVYGSDIQHKMRTALDSTVEVSGNYEMIGSDMPRLLAVDGFKIKKQGEKQASLFKSKR